MRSKINFRRKTAFYEIDGGVYGKKKGRRKKRRGRKKNPVSKIHQERNGSSSDTGIRQDCCFLRALVCRKGCHTEGVLWQRRPF